MAQHIRRRDEGAVLPLVLVLIVVGALIVIPVMTYSITVLRANEVEREKTRNVEAAKGAIRTALRSPGVAFGDADRANAGCPNDEDLLPIGGEVVTDVAVTIDCTPVSELSANEVFGFEVPVGAAQLQIAPAPAGFGEFSGVLASSPEAPPYPVDAGTVSWAWWQSFSWQNPDPDESADIKTIWVPELPTFTDVSRPSTALTMPGFDCRVFLPGRYEDPLVIDGSGPIDNYYFASGVYYFEDSVTISGDVRVVVGQGLADFGVTNDCADDIQVGANVSVPANTVYAIDGNSGGATWIFGDRGRLIVSETGGAPSVRFNQRYATRERGGWINIASVNGDSSWSGSDPDVCDADDDCFEDPNGNHSATNVNFVPRSQVVVRDVDDTIDIVELGDPGAPYVPSHPDLTDEARPPSAPTAVTATPRLVDGDGAIEVTFRGVEGAATNGAIVTAYEAGVQTGGASPPAPAPTTTCSTDGGDDHLVPVAEGVDGADLWGRPHPENASDPDRYSCLITGLAAGQRYWVSARAVNEAGWGAWAPPTQVAASAWSGVSEASPAQPPTDVVVQPYDDDPALPDAALVSWNPSPASNGAPVDGYDVQVYRVFLQDEATTTTTTSSTTTTTTTSTSSTTTTTTTTLPPASATCGPPLDCSTIPPCPGSPVPTAVYVSGAWQWSCAPSCGVLGEIVTTGAGTGCAYLASCSSVQRPATGLFPSCINLRVSPSVNAVNHGYGIPNTPCPSGTSPRFGYGTGFCAVNGPQPFRSPVAVPQQVPDPGTTTTTTTTTTTVPEPSFVEVEELIDTAEARCSTEPRMGRTPEDAGVEWTPPPTRCVIPSLPPLEPTGPDGRDNVGYRISVTARTSVGSSAPAVSDPPVMAVTGEPGALEPLPAERVWFPYSGTSIIDIDTSGAGNTVVDIPGYVSVPMGRIRVANPSGDDVSISGGIVAGRFDVVDGRTPLPYGYVPSVVMQRTVRLTATAGNIRSTALVRINSDTSYGIVRWVTQ